MDDEKNTHWLGVEGAKRNVCDRQTGRQTILRVQTMFRVYRMGGVQVFFSSYKLARKRQFYRIPVVDATKTKPVYRIPRTTFWPSQHRPL